MNRLTDIARYLVGGLFIFSGMIKVNDPVGTGIKLEEYFDVFAGDIAPFFEIFSPWALELAVVLNVLEVVLGVALIMRFRVKLTLWILLLMIVFFTFLTFYSAYYNKVTDCGCFGDAIKLTPWESFTKDIILLILIAFLFFFRKKIQNNTFATTGVVIVSTTFISLFLAMYAIKHLPFLDFRAYKVGTNIADDMIPEESPRFEYIFDKNGEEVRSERFLPESEGYKMTGHELVNPEKSTPKITDYSLWNEEGDFTEASLKGKWLFVIIHKMDKSDKDSFSKINELSASLPAEVKVVLLTSSSVDDILRHRAETGFKAPFYYGDATLLKTIIRSNPGLVLMDEGVVKGKWHFNDTPNAFEIRKKLNR